jgi:hypothetical protein
MLSGKQRSGYNMRSSIGLERHSGWSMWRWVFELEAALSWAATACAKLSKSWEDLAK